MQYVSLFLMTTLFFSQANSWGEIQNFKIENETLKVEVPDQWTAMPNTFGIPLSIVSKAGENGDRAVVEIVPLAKDENDTFKKFDKNETNYVKEKEDWLEAIDGAAISYDKLAEDHINGATIHSMGFTHKSDMGEFHDRSFYVITKSKKVFYIKTLVPTDLEATQNTHLNEVVRSIASVE